MIKAKKELGQNFLKDFGTIVKMVNALEITSEHEVMEIGPGLGALTQQILSKNPKKLTAIEFDNRLSGLLHDKFMKFSNFEIIHANVLDWLTKERKFDSIIGSLPFYITSPILHKIIFMENLPTTCVFMTQKEVALKICPKTEKGRVRHSYLSVFIQTFYDVEYLGIVPRTWFDPVPGVDGGIIKCSLKKDCKFLDFEKKRKLEGFLHKGFSNPRKMINKVFEVDQLEKLGINPNMRPEDLSIGEWHSLYQTSL